MHIFLHTNFHVQMYQAGPSTGIFWTCKLPVCVSCSLLLSFFLSICFSLSQLTLCDFCCCCKSYINLKWKMTWPTSSGEIWKETLLLLQQTNGNFYKKKPKRTSNKMRSGMNQFNRRRWRNITVIFRYDRNELKKQFTINSIFNW